MAQVIQTRHAEALTATVLGTSGERIPTVVTISPLPAAPNDDSALQWVLQPDTAAPVRQSTDALAASRRTARAETFAALARALAAQPTRERLAAAVVRAATRIVPHADDAGLTIVHGRAEPVLIESTSPAAAACEQARAPDEHVDDRPFAETVGLRSVICLPLDMPRPYSATLALYGRRPGVFTQVEHAAAVLAVHAGLAFTRMLSEEDLRAALATRQLVGQAIGILIERRKLSAEAAFEQLVRASQSKHIKVRDLALAVVETGLDPSEVFLA